MKHFFWTSLIFLVSFSFACNTIDSNSNNIGASSEKDSVSLWLTWATDSLELSKDQKKGYLQRAFSHITENQENDRQIENLIKTSFAYLVIKDSANFKKVNTILLQKAIQKDDHKAHGMAHWDLADFYRNTRPDSSYYHYREAYIQFSKAELEEKLRDYPARMLYAMASIKESSKDYVGAEKEAIKAIELYKIYNSEKRLFNAYDLLAIIQNGLEKFDKALEYHHKAQMYIQSADLSRHYEFAARNANNTANTYLRSKNYEKAFELFDNLEKEDSLQWKKPRLYAQVLASKAYSNFKSGSVDYDNILGNISRSSHILDSLGDSYTRARNDQYAAEILAKTGDTLNAIASGLLARRIAKQTENNDRLLSSLKLLTTLDKNNSAQHAKAYFDLNEELQLQERTIQDKFARIQMETDEVIEENEALARRTELLAGIAIGLLILGIGVFTIISQRISNQRLKFQQKQQENNQEIYNLMLAQHGKMEEGKKSEQKRVSEELHDGILGQMLGIRLILSGLNERNDPSAIEQRGELIEKLQELEEEIRTISHELNASAYKKVHNFILSLQDLVSTVAKSSNITIDFEYDNHFEWDGLLSDIKINSYRITQELLQNCVKHAQCKNVTVTFQKTKNLLNLTIEDDGIGFDDSKAKKGIGLKNIISRVKKMGAQLEIESQPSKGTKVSITIPNIDLKSQRPKAQNLRNKVVEA